MYYIIWQSTDLLVTMTICDVWHFVYVTSKVIIIGSWFRHFKLEFAIQQISEKPFKIITSLKNFRPGHFQWQSGKSQCNGTKHQHQHPSVQLSLMSFLSWKVQKHPETQIMILCSSRGRTYNRRLNPFIVNKVST